MQIAVLFLLLLIGIALFRLLLYFVSRKIKNKYGISITYQNCFLLEFTAFKIEKEGKFTIEIEKVNFASSIFSSSVKKPITLCLGLTNIVIAGSFKDETVPRDNTPQSSVRTTGGKTIIIPHQLSTVTTAILQFVGISVEEFTAVIKRNEFVTVLSGKIKADFSSCQTSANARSTGLSIVLDDTHAKLLHEDLPLMEISCQIFVNTTIQPGNPLESSEVKVQFSKLKSICNENLLKSLFSIRKQRKMKNEENPESELVRPTTLVKTNTLQNFPQFEIGLEDCKASFLSSDGRELSICWHCSFLWKKFTPEGAEELETKSYCATLDITGLVLNGGPSEKYLLIKQITAETQIVLDKKQTECNVNVNFDTFHVNYSKDAVGYWIKQYKEAFSSVSTQSEINYQIKRKSNLTHTLSTLCQDLKVKSRLNFQNCSCDIVNEKRPIPLTGPSLITFSIGEIDVHGDLTDSIIGHANRKDARGLLHVKDVYCYVDLKEVADNCNLQQLLPCIACDDKPAILPSSEQHVWGRLFEFGSSFLEVKCEHFLPGSMPNLISISGQASYITVEVSAGMVLSLLEVAKLMDIKLTKKKERALPLANEPAPEKNAFRNVSVDAEVRITNLNAFLLGQREDGLNSLLAKVDSVDVATGQLAEPMLWEASGIKLTRLKDIKKGRPFFCMAAKFLPAHIGGIPSVSACFFRTAKPQSLSISIQESAVDWTPVTHMVLKELSEDFLLTKDAIRDSMKKEENFLPDKAEVVAESKTPSSSLKFDIISLKLNMKASDVNSFTLDVKNFSFNSTGMGMNILASDSDIYFDDKRIFHIEDIEIKKMPLNHLQETRQAYATLRPINPRVWGISFHSIHAFFPYMFNFASSLEKIQNIFKMLKYLHKKPKDISQQEPLPPDLLLHCENLTVEFEDDIFEIKLENNYMLLRDEREQCIQRENKLREKLDKIASTQGTFFSSKKFDEILQSLTEKNTQIYINRSKLMYENGIAKRAVFRCVLRGLELTILADPSLHGHENVVNKMKSIDSESPIPDDIKFTTLWCRMVEGRFRFCTAIIREYPQPFLTMEAFTVNGMLIGAEECGIERATRSANVEIEKPWDTITVQKNMAPLKFYHDLTFGMRSFDVAWGVNFEAGWAMASQSFDLLSKPAIDKSDPLPFWDKCRLLLHGHLKMIIGEWNILLSASKDPYNTTEKMVMALQNVDFDWTNAKMVFKGDFDLHTRTASKYDDSQVLRLPDLCITVDLEWLCEGNPNAHHNVVPCNPKKVNTDFIDYDTFRMFRTKNLNLNVKFECSQKSSKEDPPSLYLYASTFRWFQKYQAVVISNVSRPIKRGRYFNNVKPRKPTLGRHYKLINIDFTFPRLNVNYWGSFTQESGFQVAAGAGGMGISYHVFVSNVVDERNLIRRPLAQWIITSLRSEVDRVHTTLLNEEIQTETDIDPDEHEGNVSTRSRLARKHFLFSVKRVTYNRQSPSSDLSSYSHKVRLNDFRGAWTDVNRKIILSLFEAYTKMQILKRVLSSDAMKTKTPKSHEFRREHKGSVIENSPNPLSKLQSGSGAKLLQQLLSDEEKFVAQAEEVEQEVEANGGEKCDDIIQYNWHIDLVNSQVMLRGIETTGAIILTSAKTEILKRLHTPVAVNSDAVNKLNKVSWSGKLENLQYFSTTKDLKEFSASTIPWLTTTVIAGSQGGNVNARDNDVSSYLQSSDSVGSTVNVIVKGVPIQLQRVISRCGCDFYYLSLDPELDPVAEEYEPSTVQSSKTVVGSSPNLANHLQVRHPTLEISTSPAQFEMFMDITQNLLLYTESKKKEEQERLDKMKFRLQLYTEQDLRGHIQELQTSVRSLVLTLRIFERRLYDIRQQENTLKGQADDSSIVAFLNELMETTIDLQEQIEVTKDHLYADSEDLAILIRAYKDVQKMKLSAPSPTKDRYKAYVIKQIDVLFDDMKWRMTQKDGQLGIAEVQFRKFWYNKQNFNDNSCEHKLELGSFTVVNMIPDEVYKHILSPHEINLRRRVDKSVFLRVYCRAKAPVAGISVKEHFEVNVCPIAVRLTYRFYHEQEAFFFPHKTGGSDGAEVSEFDLGVRAREEEKEELKTKEESDGTSAFLKAPPPRPPPPLLTPRLPLSRVATFRKGSSSGIVGSQNEGTPDLSEKSKKKASMSIAVPAAKDVGSPPTTPSTSTPNTPSKSPFIKKGASFYRAFSSDESVDKMKERASKNQTFIYVKVPEIPICFSYKGEKERNIEDAHDFNLCLPTLEYHNRIWTWQDLLNGIKKDYTQVLVPQIIKEKLRLTGGWENKPSMAQADDEDKAKLLFGEKQSGTQKKAGKKLLFGKLSSLVSGGSKNQDQQPQQKTNEKQSNLEGKGVEPEALQETFTKLRTMSKEDMI